MLRPGFATTLAVLSLVALGAAAGCGSRSVGGAGGPDAPGAGSGDPASGGGDAVTRPSRKVSVVWLVEPSGAGNRIGLTITDETGAVRNEPVAELAGACSRGLAQDPDAATVKTLLAIGCREGAVLRVLRVLRRGGELVVMRGGPDPDTGELWFEEQTRVAIPSDAEAVSGE